jgi:hypothetical protein
MPRKFVAIAFNGFCCIGFEFNSTVVKPYFEKLVRRRRAGSHAGASTWFRGRSDFRRHRSEAGKRLNTHRPLDIAA